MHLPPAGYRGGCPVYSLPAPGWLLICHPVSNLPILRCADAHLHTRHTEIVMGQDHNGERIAPTKLLHDYQLHRLHFRRTAAHHNLEHARLDDPFHIFVQEG
jgi:hypothetical protein